MNRGLWLFGCFVWILFHAILYHTEIISFEVTLLDFLSLIVCILILKGDDKE